MAAFTEYTNYDGLGLAQLIRDKQVSAGEVLEAALAAAAAVDPQIHAIVYDMTDEATRTIEAGLPAGPFSGVPFVIKDFVINYAGVPTTSGSRLFAGLVPEHDTELMARFRRAGLVTFAKTTTSEVGFNANTEAIAYDNPTCNPWDPSRTSSGSSGGSAASVAAGIVPLAHANDGGGSIRMPASANGVLGLKPTRGRVPLGPDLGDDGLACLPVELVVSRSVRDTAAALDAVAGPDIGASFWAPPPARRYLDEVDADPGRLKIAFSPGLSDDIEVHPDAVTAVQDAAALCEELGHDVVETDLKIDRAGFTRAWAGAMIAWIGPMLDGVASALGRTPGPDNLEWATWSVLQHARVQKSAELVGAQILFNGLSREFGAFFQDYDLLLTPTTSEPPFKSGRLNQNEEGIDAYEFIDKGTFTFGHTTAIFNATGQPAISVPLYWNAENLPIGAQFVGRYADETTLIRLAGQLEKARPWWDKRPPVCA